MTSIPPTAIIYEAISKLLTKGISDNPTSTSKVIIIYQTLKVV